jgi:L-amino acid N-acyltransferase YncA
MARIGRLPTIHSGSRQLPNVLSLVEIRDATPADAEGIVDILNPMIAAGVYTVFDTALTSDTERAFIRNFPERGIFHVAVNHDDRRVVGFQNMEPMATYTHAFDHVGSIGTYVDLGFRRKGIASRLFEATFAAAVKKGYEKAFTFVRADNPAALQTYLRQGFRVIGTATRHARIGGRYIDEILLEKLF